MAIWRKLESWLSWFPWYRRRAREADLARELGDHLNLEAEEQRTAGLSPEEAAYAAHRALGNTLNIEEDVRAAWGLQWLETLVQDMRYGLRQLRRNPGFASVAVLTLALGIGANTAIFSVINAVLLQPLPFRDSGRLVALRESWRSPGNYPLTGLDYLSWESQNRSLAATSLYSSNSTVNASGAGQPDPASMVQTQANFFSTLGAEPLLGRTFASGEDRLGKNHVAVLSYGFWQKHFAGSATAIGRTIELNEEPFAVVGVMPAWFNFPPATDLWTPNDMSPAALGTCPPNCGNHNWYAIARMKPGVTVPQARADLNVILQRLAKFYPDNDSDVQAVVIPLKEQLTRGWRGQLLLLLGAVGLVLLIACANLANLLLVRGASRRHEFALRASLGADRTRLVHQLLVESFTLALAGAAAGLAVAWWAVAYLQDARTVPIPRATPVRVDVPVLVFALGISVLAGIFFGIAPALHASRTSLSGELKSGTRGVGTGTVGPGNLRNVFVVAEIAMSLALLIGAGLLVRSFVNMRNADIGARTDHILTMNVALPVKKYPDMSARYEFLRQLLAAVRGIPGVDAAALSNVIPLEAGPMGYVDLPGTGNPAATTQLVYWAFVTPDYFHLYGVPVIEGRTFSIEDSERTAETKAKLDVFYKAATDATPKIPPTLALVAVINRAMARAFWPNQDPIGKVFRGGPGGSEAPIRVIGVVGDVNEDTIRERAHPEAYFPLAAGLDWSGTARISIRTGIAPTSLLGEVRRELRHLDSNLAIFRVRTMGEVIADHMQDTSLQAFLLGLFSTIAVLLAALGIYGVMAYLVTQRSHEIGIRMALGAQHRDIVRMVLGEGLLLTFIGIVIGIAGALTLTRFLRSLLFEINPTDPATFIGVAILLTLVALLACYIPMRRAVRVDPMIALRYE